MKELSIEEKAKRYDEAIEKFDVILNLNTVKESGTIFADDVRKIFPELKDSDDEIRKSIIGFLKTIASLKDGKTVSNKDFDSKALLEWTTWLEKQGVQKCNWSEDDISNIDHLLNALCGVTELKQFQIDKLIIWLKSLKSRVQSQNLTVTDEELAQAKKDAYNDALDKIEYHSGTPSFDDGWSAAIWYLKKRDILKSQSTWKPSEEQMQVLIWCLPLFADPKLKETLKSLIDDLKKL